MPRDLHSVLDAVLDGVVVLDAEGRVESVNSEACRILETSAESCAGAPIEILDIGGGLGIDYDGSQSATDSSVNYTLDQYAADVVHRVKAICDDAEVPHPTIMTESGRAIVAHASVLVCEVIGTRAFPSEPDMHLVETALAGDEPPQPLLDAYEAYLRRHDGDPTEAYADAVERAMLAGVDACELHAGHGYLIDNFLSPTTNHREDAYGGPVENRARFLVDVLTAIRARVGRDFPVWCRINGEELLIMKESDIMGVLEGAPAKPMKKAA